MFWKRKKAFDDEQKTKVADLIAEMLAVQVDIGGGSIENAEGQIIRKAIGYIYGFADCALRNIGQDMGDASVGVPVIYQVLRRLFPEKAEEYVTFLIDNMSDERVLLGMMTGGQQYADYFCKPGREGIPMGLARVIHPSGEEEA